MTKAGEEWFRKVCLYAYSIPVGAEHINVAEFWTECFYFAVRVKARIRCEHDGVTDPPCDHCLARALEEHVNDTRKMF